MRLPLGCCLSAAVTVALPSQTTHLVGPGGLPQIRDALAIAAPGDLVHIAPGTYAHFTATVGVTMRALVPGTVQVVFDPAFLPAGCATSLPCLTSQGPTRFEVPSGQTMNVVGVNFVGNEASIGFGQTRHRVVVSSGRVAFDGCELHASNTIVLSVGSASVHLQSCLVSSTPVGSPLGGTAIAAANADLTLIDSQIAGGHTLGGVWPPGHGIQLNGGTLHGSNLVIYSGGLLFPSSGPAAFAVNGSGALWLADSQLIGGCPLQWSGQSPELSRCTLTASNPGCPTVPTFPGFLLGMERLSPLQAGAPFGLRFRTQPNGYVAIFASGGLGRLDLPGLLAQPSWLDDTQAFYVGLVLADGNGLATASWMIPTGPGIVDLHLWFKGLSGWTFPLQVSPPAGGVVR